MQKQEDEKLERRLHQVMEQIQPDEDAKDRMYLLSLIHISEPTRPY